MFEQSKKDEAEVNDLFQEIEQMINEEENSMNDINEQNENLSNEDLQSQVELSKTELKKVQQLAADKQQELEAKITQLQQEKQASQAQIQELQSQAEVSKTELEKLEATITQLQQEKQASQAHIKDLQSQVEFSNTELEKAQQLAADKQQELEAKITELQQKTERYQEQIKDLQSQVEVSQTELGQLKNKISQLEQETEQLRQQRQQLYQDIAEQRTQLNEDKFNLEKSQQELELEKAIFANKEKDLQARIAQTKEQENHLQRELEQLENQEKQFQREQRKLALDREQIEREQQSIEQKYLALYAQEQEINQKKQELKELELQAQSGFIQQNTSIISELQKQINNLHQERNKLYQEVAEKQKQLESEVARKQEKLEQDRIEQYKQIEARKQELETKRQELEAEFINKQNQLERKLEEELRNEKLELEEASQQLAEERKQLKRQESKLEADQQLLEEDRENLDEKINQKAATKIETLQARINFQKEELKESRRIRDILQNSLIKIQEANRLFGNKTPDEILAEIENLRKTKQELEKNLASKPSEIALEKLAKLEAEQEQWESERLRLTTELQEIKRNSTYNKIAVTEVETLRDEKEALEVSNSRLRSALEELRKEVSQEVENSKNTSPFPECFSMDENRILNQTTPLENDIPDLQKFAEDLRYRIAVSSEDEKKRLYYSARDVRIFLGGLAMSRLHLLEGISGTGKTSLAIAFSKAVKGGNNLIEVQAGWRDRQDLIGYYNAFEKRFYESEFLQALYEAQCPSYQNRIYIIILDEMNLSRPEQYFADFLSKLEQESPKLTFTTNLNRRFPRLFEDNGKSLKIPQNVWFIGTANQDETTLEFADKTYDRSHIMELGRNQTSFDIPKLPDDRKPIAYDALMSAFEEAKNQYKPQADQANQFLKENLANLLERKFKVGWGNRLEKQMQAFIPVVIASGGTLGEATDHLIATKILRKIKNRYDTPASDLRELRETLTTFWSELDKNPPTQSLNIINREINRIEPGEK